RSEVNPEFSVEQHYYGCAVLAGIPLRSLIPCGVDAPLYFYVSAGSDAVVLADKMTNEPSSRLAPVLHGVAVVNLSRVGPRRERCRVLLAVRADAVGGYECGE